MHLVSQNTEEEISRYRLQVQVRSAIRQLSENILHMTGGAGNPERIGLQTIGLLQAMQDHRDALGCYPDPDELRASLSLWGSEPQRRGERDAAPNSIMTRETVEGALQLAASCLSERRMQEAAGATEGAGFQGVEEPRSLAATGTPRPTCPATQKSACERPDA